MVSSLAVDQGTGAEVGMGAAFMSILVVWALGSAILGLLAYFTRGRREFVTVP
jgi:hypothetical protein